VMCGVSPTNTWFDACGNGGSVTVNTSVASGITTTGRDAHGVLAQSIGGGGGWIAGLTLANTDPFDKPQMAGSAGDINLSLAGSIATSGAGAYGVLAQSVGGGGVLGGDLAQATTVELFPHDFYGDQADTRDGSGGNIVIANSGSIATSGANAPAVFAQSVGGGGGLYATTNGNVFMGSAGGTGDAGSIVISNGGTISASGSGSSAVYVNSQGHSNDSDVLVTNSAGGTITGNNSAPTILLTGGNKNGDGAVNNSGTIVNANGTAIASPTSFAVVNNNAGGVIYGNVNIGSGTLTNQGYWGTNDSSTVGQVNSTGTLNIYGADYNHVGTSTLVGNLTSYGTIQTSVDFYNKQASTLNVTGTANIGDLSTIFVRPVTLSPGGVTIINAASVPEVGYIRVTDPGSNFLFNYGVTYPNAQSLAIVTTNNDLVGMATVSTNNPTLINVATSLANSWADNAVSASLAKTYASLATITNGPQYVSALTNISNESTQAASVAHVVASNAFVERLNSCPRFDEGAQFQSEHDCLWGRVIGNNGDHDATGDSVGYRQNGSVFQFGGQKEVASDWFVGGSISADHSSLDTRAVDDSVDGHGWTGGMVAKHQMGNWLVSASIEGGQMSYNSTRQIQLPGLSGEASSSFDVSHWGLHSRITRQFAFQNWYLKPYIDVHATHIQSDGYTEHGAGALDLKASPSSANVFGASPMLEAGSKLAFANGMTLQLYGGVGGAFYNQSTLGADMRFADSALGAGNFRVTSDLPQDRLKTTTGVDLKTSDRIDIRLEYTGEFADHFESNTGSLKFTYKF
jgi:uncharacterized protein with beta-barrel porin domain